MRQIEWQVLGAVRAMGPIHFSEVLRMLGAVTDNEKNHCYDGLRRLLGKTLVWENDKHCDVTNLGRIAFEAELRRRKGQKAPANQASDTPRPRQTTWGEE